MSESTPLSLCVEGATFLVMGLVFWIAIGFDPARVGVWFVLAIVLPLLGALLLVLGSGMALLRPLPTDEEPFDPHHLRMDE
jgi:membrane-bound metal-dependent hydrolase YbcI (DUF457 family)